MDINTATRARGQLFPFDGAQVAFSQLSRSLLLLNDSAALLWQIFESGGDVATAASELSSHFSIAPELAERDARRGYEALEKHLAAALLRVERGTDEDWFGYRMMVGALDDGAASQPPDLVVSLFGQRIGLAASSDLHQPLRGIFGARASEPEGDRTSLEVTRAGELVSINGAGPIFAVPRPPSETLPLICQAIFATALKRAGFALVIHAACVRRGDRTFLLPGLSGSGKSTLTAALGRNGFQIVADDTTVFLAADGVVCPSAFWLSIKEGSNALLADTYPELTNLDLWTSRDRVVRMLPNPMLEASSAQVTDIVFPSYRGPADGSVSFQPIGKAEALLRITDSGYWFPAGISAVEIEKFLGFVEHTPCAELYCSNLEASIAFFKRLASE